jgi:hypothetical protein
MPFNSSYKDYDKLRYLNARDFFRNLANVVIRDPLSTHIIKMSARDDKVRYIIVDRSQSPDEGDIAVVCTPRGLRVGRIKRADPREDIWGKVVWYIQEG